MDLNSNQERAAEVGGFKKLPYSRDLVRYGASMNTILGISSEAGEVQDIYKKYLERGIDIDKELLVKELGDVLWYVAAIALQEGISLEAVARTNIWKLEDKYSRA